MAIGPQTNALIDSYKLKIEQKRKNRVEIEEVKKGYNVTDSDGTTIARIENLDVVINSFTPAINGLDTEVLRINGLINDQQTILFNLYTGATEVGCTTHTIAMVDTLRDDVRGYNYSFSGENPFVESNAVITSANIGFGTYTGITQVSLGTFHGLDTGADPACPSYATSITTAENTITTLRSQRDDVISPVQELKEARAEYQLQRYGYDNAIERLDTEIAEAETIITALEGSDSQYFLE